LLLTKAETISAARLMGFEVVSSLTVSSPFSPGVLAGSSAQGHCGQAVQSVLTENARCRALAFYDRITSRAREQDENGADMPTLNRENAVGASRSSVLMLT
jgi:hypothetical protein